MKLTPAERAAKAKPVKTPAQRKSIFTCHIKALRQGLGLTMRDVQKGTGVSSASLCLIERGTDIQVSTAKKLARFFGKTIEELWTE